jgi:chromosome segregation ATPase
MSLADQQFQFHIDRQDRLEAAIERLTEISSDLKSMIAVHEQRLTQQERSSDFLEQRIEQQRTEVDQKINTVYTVMDRQDNNIFDKIDRLQREFIDSHRTITSKIEKLQKFMWMAIGGGIAISWIISTGLSYLRITH